MANELLTLNAITREAIRLFINTNAFIRNLDRQYDDQFAVSGAKIGRSLRIRLPNDYTVADGPALSPQDTQEQSIALPLATQRHVDVAFDSAQRTLELDDYAERVIAPAMNNLAGNVAKTIMAGAEGGAANLVQNVDGSGAPITPTIETITTADASLDLNSAPGLDRMLVVGPMTNARTVTLLSGLFNPQQQIGSQFMSGQMKNALGFDWLKDQTVIAHTTGTFSAGGAVNGANQTGRTITVTAITGTLKKGDIVTFAGLNAVNRVTKETTGQLRQFAITEDAINGATSIKIYPSIVPPVGGSEVQYQTVAAALTNGAQMALVNKASSTFWYNLAFAPEAITMVTADLELPGGVSEEARDQYDGVSMRMVTQYAIGTDQKFTRTDVIFGFLFIRPEWLVIVPDKI